MVTNGRIPLTNMVSLLDGQLLLRAPALAVLTAVKVGKLTGNTIAPPKGGDRGISGFRDLARQTLFVKASRGDKVAAARCNMDPTMRTNVGAVGGQSHGWGDRIDLLFNGRSPDTDDINLMGRYGAIQEFGDDDRNHWWVKNPNTTVGEGDRNRIVAHWLNTRIKDEHTSTDVDGKWPGTECHFSHMLQLQGHADGLYPAPYKIDGVRGARTHWLRNHYFTALWARA